MLRVGSQRQRRGHGSGRERLPIGSRRLTKRLSGGARSDRRASLRQPVLAGDSAEPSGGRGAYRQPPRPSCKLDSRRRLQERPATEPPLLHHRPCSTATGAATAAAVVPITNLPQSFLSQPQCKTWSSPVSPTWTTRCWSRWLCTCPSRICAAPAACARGSEP